MRKNEYTFPSSDGKTPIHVMEWLPEEEPVAILQLSHGVAEYIDRYEGFASYLTDRGFAVVGNDHIGHGKSIVPGAKPLYFGPPGSWNLAVDDMYALRERTGMRFSGVPYFLLGHSMGSFLARTYLIRYPGTVSGAILMGTGQMSSAMIAGGKLIAKRQLKKVGAENSSPVVDQLAFGAYNKRFTPHRTAFDWLSVNEENVDRYIKDPLCGGNASTGLFLEMLEGIRFNQNPKNLRRMNLSTPVLFVSGAMDPVGNFGKSVQNAFESFRRAGVHQVSIKLYPHLRHEILNENCGDVVYRDLYEWMAAKIPERAEAAAR